MGGLGNFRLSYITIYALVAIVFTWVLWNKTRFGKNLFAIGEGDWASTDIVAGDVAISFALNVAAQ